MRPEQARGFGHKREMGMTGSEWWQPAAFAARRPFLDARARIAASLRRWFDEAGFTEVDTPALQVSPGLEPHLKAFAT